MKLWHIVGIMMIGAIFLYQNNDRVSLRQIPEQQRQEQQEDPRIMEESLERLSYKVVYQSPNLEQDDVADIQWLKKAAKVALGKGRPFFNIMDQRMIKSSRLVKGRGRNTVEGTIQLSLDPMDAEYDAREITSLVPVSTR